MFPRSSPGFGAQENGDGRGNISPGGTVGFPCFPWIPWLSLFKRMHRTAACGTPKPGRRIPNPEIRSVSGRRGDVCRVEIDYLLNDWKILADAPAAHLLSAAQARNSRRPARSPRHGLQEFTATIVHGTSSLHGSQLQCQCARRKGREQANRLSASAGVLDIQCSHASIRQMQTHSIEQGADMASKRCQKKSRGYCRGIDESTRREE